MSIHATWLEPTGPAGGQDHLATRAICEILYRQLLPGITNVTERARYYTLYPWLLWVMDQEGIDPEQRTLWFRKADCLLTLIALHHGQGHEHSRAAIGSTKLTEALRAARDAKGSICLSTWARADEVPERYFASSRGGFGQYYQGPLEELGVVARDARGGLTWSKTAGQQLGQLVDARTDRARFARCVAHDQVLVDDLLALDSLCLCRLTSGGAERDALLELLWSEGSRQQALGLLLSLARDLPDGCRLDVPTFRGATATGALPDGNSWELPGSLQHARRRWATYQRSEWLSVAVQGLFWATLWEVGVQGRLPRVSAFGDKAVEVFSEHLGLDASLSWEDAVSHVRATLPPEESWSDPDHEHQRALRIVRTSRSSQVAREAVQLILSLFARTPLEEAFAQVKVSLRQREEYPVHLVALAQRRASWSTLTIRQVLHDLVTTWGVLLHDRVALRKLRYQLKDTFQIRPTETGELVVEEIPEPVFGRPRIEQAIHILEDLGILTRDRRRLTERGAALLEELRG
jgi:hypothetical protein